MNSSNCCILVSSFDRYAVCWEPFLHGIEKYWPQHPDLYFITNLLECNGAFSIKVGADCGWAANLKYALAQLDTEFILYSQEDYWIQNTVDHTMIMDYLGLLASDKADYIRLYPAPPPDASYANDPRLGIIKAGSQYRASLQMALWRKKTLIDLLDVKESPWQFEVKGSERSNSNRNRFLCVSNRRYGIDYVFTAIVNGYWSKRAHEYAEKEELVIDFSALPKKKMITRMKDQFIDIAYRVKKKIKNEFSSL